MPPIINNNENQTPEENARHAYTRILSEVDAVPDALLVTINIDVPTAVTNTLGLIAKIAPFEEPAKKLPDFDAACFTKLESYALALSHTQTLYMGTSAPADDVSALVAQAADAREMLLEDVRPLARRGFIEPKRVADMERSLGHRGVAYDVLNLVQVMREHWNAVSTKTALTAEKLDELETLSNKLLRSVGQRDQSPAVRGEAVERRQKAFTLFANAYEEVRAAVAFLRRKQDDVDQIVPSLYAGRARRKAEQPVEPTPAPIVPAVPQHDVQTAPAPKVAPGMPGANPYMGE